MLFLRGLGLTRDPYARTTTSADTTTTRTRTATRAEIDAASAPAPVYTAPAPTEPAYTDIYTATKSTSSTYERPRTTYVEPTPEPTSTFVYTEPVKSYVAPTEPVFQPREGKYEEAPPPSAGTQVTVAPEPSPTYFNVQTYVPEPSYTEPSPPPPSAPAQTSTPTNTDDGGTRELPWEPYTPQYTSSYSAPAPTSSAPPPSAGTQVKTNAVPSARVAWYSPSAWAAAFRSLPTLHKGALVTGLVIATLGAVAVGESRRRRST
jgi:hypothetical protein